MIFFLEKLFSQKNGNFHFTVFSVELIFVFDGRFMYIQWQPQNSVTLEHLFVAYQPFSHFDKKNRKKEKKNFSDFLNLFLEFSETVGKNFNWERDYFKCWYTNWEISVLTQKKNYGEFFFFEFCFFCRYIIDTVFNAIPSLRNFT